MGEVVSVRGGYARNFLVPRGMAVLVTRGRVKEIEEQKKVLEAKAARQREMLMGIAEKISATKAVLTARCSASGKLFGSITNRQLAAAIEEMIDEELDRHKITIGDKIRAVGTYTAKIRLHRDVEIDYEFVVEGEGFEPDEADEEKAKADESAAKASVEEATAEEAETAADTEAEAPVEELPTEELPTEEPPAEQAPEEAPLETGEAPVEE